MWPRRREPPHDSEEDRSDKTTLTLSASRHPYDDPDVIAGHGSIGMEILRQRMGGIHAAFVPVGGGGG